MIDDYEIVKESFPTQFIEDDGNVYNNEAEPEKYFLKNNNGGIISFPYYYMISLGDDHFAVCDLISHVRFFTDYYNEYSIIYGDYEVTTSKLKWGIIRINRNENGNIIPFGEKLVVPYLYDGIGPNNLKTAFVWYNNNLSYLDLDINRDTYGTQLLPCILDLVQSFNLKIKGFAECSINETVGYLPRNCKIIDKICESELLTEEQAKSISEFLNGKEDTYLDEETIEAYFNLTGIKLEPVKKLTRENYKPQNWLIK